MEISFTKNKFTDEIDRGTFLLEKYPVKNLLLHLIVLLIITMLVSIFFVIYLNIEDFNLPRQSLMAVFFFLISTGHIFLFPKWIQHITNFPLKLVMFYSLAFTFMIGVSTLISFYIWRYNELQVALTAACSFLFPIIIGISWTRFIAIEPIAKIEPWIVPAKFSSAEQQKEVTKSFKIKIILKLYYFDDIAEEFDIAVAGGLRLGKTFHSFLIENETGTTKIQQLNYQLKPYGWLFFIKQFATLKRLNPALTFFDNGIKENDIVFIERINIY